MKDEFWKDIPGYEGRYQVSTLGFVRSIMRKKPHVLALRAYKSSPYYKVQLIDATGRRKWHRVHRLVYITFAGPIPEGMVIDHISGVKTDNSIDNLRAVSVADNCRNPNTIMNYHNRKHTPEEHARRSAGQKRRFQRPEEREHLLRIQKKAQETRKRNQEIRRRERFITVHPSLNLP